MKIENNPKRFFAFIICSYAIFIFIVIQVLSWTLYYNFEKAGTELTNSLSQKNLDIAVNNVQNDFESIKLYCQQLFMDKDIVSLMYGDITDQQKLNNITYRLTSYAVISSYIYSIYVYNKKFDYYYCSNQAFSDYSASFFDKDIVNVIKEAKVTDFAPVLRNIPSPYNPAESTKVYSFILYDNYSNKQLSDAALIVNVKASTVVKLLKSMNYQDNSSYIVLNTDGIIVGSSNQDDFFKSIKYDKYLGRVYNNINGSGSFISHIKNSVLFVRYFYSSGLKWNFVNTTPYDILYNSVSKIKSTTLIINLIVLVISILASFLLSRNINSPIRSLISRTTTYNQIKKDNFISFRRDILANLLQKGVNFDNLNNCFKEYNIKLDLNKNFLLIHARVDNVSNFYETYDMENRTLMLFSIGNIICEILQETFVAESIESNKDFLDILVNVDSNIAEKAEEIIIIHLLKAQEEVKRYLKLSVSFTISKQIREIQHLSEEYRKVTEMSIYRFVKGHSSIIHAYEINLPSESFIYPSNNEKQMLDLLLLGKLQAACAIYNGTVQLIIRFSYNDIIQFFTQFALSLNTFINKLNSTANTGIDFEFYRFGIFLNSAETILEINEKLELLFKEICDALEPDKEDKSIELISTINAYIKNNYNDPNLSINMLADHLDKSPTYLGRLYKKLTGQSIPDCINELRLKKAMELLSDSTMKIEEICKSIGFFNEKYFYLFFKKHIGITPSEYRNRKPKADFKV
jgi:AraC-type DNA-binding domain-containing proteins